MGLRIRIFHRVLWLPAILVLLVHNFTFAATKCDELVLSTPRLTLKPLAKADLGKIVNMITRPEFARTLNIQRAKKQDVTRALSMDATTTDDLEELERITMGIYLGDEAIGYISARLEDAHWPSPKEFKMNPIGRYQIWYSLAFAISPKHWDKGLTSEAAAEFKSFVVSKLRPDGLHGQIDPSNQKAIKLFTSLGFTQAASVDGTAHFILFLR